jgi:hypothetical protein
VIAADGERATFRDGARIDGLPAPR